MASYQIPQFLDSGDKIFGPLNIRQFGYMLGGGFVVFLVYTLTSTFLPGIGNYAFIPTIPFLGIFAYLALGKYNGRDSEIYVLKAIIYAVKPRIMMFRRVVDNSDLDSKLASLTVSEIEKKWSQAAQKSKALESNEYASFEMEDRASKARKLRSIGANLDIGQRNALEALQRSQIKIQQSSQQIQSMTPQKPGRYQPTHIINQTPVAPLQQTQVQDLTPNYFDEQ
jgi:hypothetical protein